MIIHSPYFVKSVVIPWYKTPTPVRAIAASMKTSQDTLITQWRVALGWLRPQMLICRVIG
jgi:hypothetical protein